MPATFGTHCNGCPYRGQTCHLPLSMEVNATRALLIFQAPGEQEWRRRRPVISENPYSAAARFRNSLDRIGKSRRDFSITNVVQCYPGRGSSRDKKPRAQAIRSCAQWLRADIEDYRWRRIIVFGSIPKKSIVDILNYEEGDPRFRFVKHPSGGSKNCDLDAALNWALG